MHLTSRPARFLAWTLTLSLVLPQGALGAQTTKPAQPAPPTKSAAAAPKTTANPPPGTSAAPAWPRPISLKTGTAIWDQPQVESWTNQKQIVAWSAVSYQPTGAKEPALGTVKIEGPTSVSVDERLVRMDLRITQYDLKALAPSRV